MEYTKCAICGSDRPRPFLELSEKEQDFRIVICAECGFVYLNPRFTEEERSKYYTEFYYDFRFRTPFFRFAHRFHTLRRIREICKLRKDREGRILELGCGKGDFIEKFKRKRKGWEVKGVDISETAAKIAKSKVGEPNVFCGYLEDTDFPGDYFDVVTVSYTINHIHDLHQTLRELYRVLKTDGILIVQVSDFQTKQFESPELTMENLGLPYHLYFFTRETLKRLFANFGFVEDGFDKSTIPKAGRRAGGLTRAAIYGVICRVKGRGIYFQPLIKRLLYLGDVGLLIYFMYGNIYPKNSLICLENFFHELKCTECF